MINLILQIVFDICVLGVCIGASISDIKTRKVPVVYQVLLGICSLSKFIVFSVLEHKVQWNCLLTGLFVFAIYIGMVLLFKSGIGGADTKMTSLMAFYLGFKSTMIMMVSHGVIGVAYVIYKMLVKYEKVQSIPLMPFLTAGFLIAAVVNLTPAVINLI